MTVVSAIERLASEYKLPLDSRELAKRLDLNDPLKELRSQFHIPTIGQVSQLKAHDPTKSIDQESSAALPMDATASDIDVTGDECVYLCGNSLGLQPKGTRKLLNEELDVWSES
jgi:kynureninase